MRRHWLLALVMGLGLAAAGRPARAQSAGAESFNFLSLDANARAVGMGGAYTALATDANALLYNPAGLGRVRRHEVTLMHNQYLADMTQEYVGLATRYGVGANVNYLRMGSLTRTTYSHKDGGLGHFGVDDLALGAGYGATFYDALSLGAAIKYIREANDNVSASGYAFDLGALASLPELPWLRLGMSVLNIGPDVRFIRGREHLPLTYRGGAAVVLDDLAFAADFSKNLNDRPRAAMGVEKILMKVMAVRLGFTMRNDADVGITGGVGWVWRDWAADYAFAPYGELGIAHRVSLTFRWGGTRPALRGEEKPVPPSREDKQRRFMETSEELQPGPVVPVVPQRESAELHFERARLYIEARNFMAARMELEAALKLLGPEDRSRVLYFERQGFISFTEGDTRRAKAFYTEGLQFAGALGLKDRYVADAYVGMGNCLAKEGDLTYALKFYQKAFDISPALSTQRFIEEIQAQQRGGKSKNR